MDGMLSQEEIEALLKDGDGQKNDTAEIGLTDVEKDAVG